jgi:hypothetical protein
MTVTAFVTRTVTDLLPNLLLERDKPVTLSVGCATNATRMVPAIDYWEFHGQKRKKMDRTQ